MSSRPRFRIVALPLAFVTTVRRTLADPLGHALRISTQPSPVTCRFTLRLVPPAEEIADACVGSDDPEAIIAGFFSNSLVDCIHARSLTHGCFTFKIARA